MRLPAVVPSSRVRGESPSDVFCGWIRISFLQPNGGTPDSEDYEYGITFINRRYLERVWESIFGVVDVVAGGIRDFQDIVVLEAP